MSESKDALDTESERTKIENYLKLYCLEECLDEAINEVVEKRPANPYLHISRFMETKTLPEIMDLRLVCCIVGRGLVGVEATLTTNLSQFTASCPISMYGGSTVGDMLIDFAVIESKAKEAVRGLDPTKMEEIDEVIMAIGNITPPCAMAISIACCRAGARHSGKPLHRFLAEMIECTPKVPAPVVSVIGRAAGNSINVSQTINVIPTTPSFFDGAMEAVLHAAQSVNRKLDELKIPATVSDFGCPTALGSTPLGDLVKIASEAFAEDAIEGVPRLCIDFRAVDLMTPIPDGEIPFEDQSEPTYQMDGPDDNIFTGSELVDMFMPMWRETGFISIEDPMTIFDPCVDEIQEKLDSIVSDIKSEQAPDLKYHIETGVGSQKDCTLQVVADRSCTSIADIEKIRRPFNAVKIGLMKGGGSVCAAMKLCQAAKEASLSVIVGCAEGGPESTDTFLADFAVAVAATQFHGGGLGSCEYACKYTRLVEIVRDDEELMYVGKKFRS